MGQGIGLHRAQRAGVRRGAHAATGRPPTALPLDAASPRITSPSRPRRQVPALVAQIREARAENSGSIIGLAAAALSSSVGWGAGGDAAGSSGADAAGGGGTETLDKKRHRAARAGLIGAAVVLGCAVWVRVATSLGPDGDA